VVSGISLRLKGNGRLDPGIQVSDGSVMLSCRGLGT
jgi:hypothetical protein